MARKSGNDRMTVTLPPDRMKEVKQMATEIGLRYSQFGGMLLWMGFRAYLRQVNPEKLFSVEQMVEMAKIAERDSAQGEEKYTL